MKAFAIRDASIRKDRDLAWLLYEPDSGSFTIEICQDVDEWEAPLILSSSVKRGKRSVNPCWSQMWVEQRIIPRERQNLGTILRDNGLYPLQMTRLMLPKAHRMTLLTFCRSFPCRQEEAVWGWRRIIIFLQKTFVKQAPCSR